MKTLNSKALALALLISAPAFAADTPAGNTQSNFLRRAYDYAKDTVVAHPYYTAAGVTAVVATPFFYKYFANKKATAQLKAQQDAKAELLTALQAKNRADADKAFNKLNEKNKAAVQTQFNAYTAADDANKNTKRPVKKRHRDQMNQQLTTKLNTARTACVKAVEALNIEEEDKSFDIDITERFTTAKDAVIAWIKKHKKTTAAIAAAGVVGAYEGVNYWKFRSNPYTLRNGFNKVRNYFFPTVVAPVAPVAPVVTPTVPAPATVAPVAPVAPVVTPTVPAPATPDNSGNNDSETSE